MLRELQAYKTRNSVVQSKLHLLFSWVLCLLTLAVYMPIHSEPETMSRPYKTVSKEIVLYALILGVSLLNNKTDFQNSSLFSSAAATQQALRPVQMQDGFWNKKSFRYMVGFLELGICSSRNSTNCND
jgi:hypothetical protein